MRLTGSPTWLWTKQGEKGENNGYEDPVMEILIALFGALTLASIVALARFEANPLFAFSLLLSGASLVWLVNMARQEGKGARPAAPRKVKRKR